MTELEKACTAADRARSNRCSSFYRDLYQGLAQPITPEQWTQVPFLTKSDILRVPFMQRLFVPWEKVDTIALTSGTTGSGVCILPRRFSLDLPSDFPYYKDHRLMTFYYYSYRIRAESKTISGDQTRYEASAQLAAQAGVDALHGSISQLIAFAPHAKRAGLISNIRALCSTGERISKLQLNTIRTLYPGAELRTVYGMQEVSVAGYSPLVPRPDRPLAVKLVPHYYFEILTEEGLVADSGTGELVVTSLEEDPFPLMRYRTGDKVSVFEDRGERLLEPLSRVEEERVRIGGGEIVLDELERAITKTFGESVADFECTVKETLDGETIRSGLDLTLFIKNNPPPWSSTDAALKLATELQANQQRTYLDGIVAGLYTPITCSFMLVGGTQLQKRRHLRDGR